MCFGQECFYFYKDGELRVLGRQICGQSALEFKVIVLRTAALITTTV